MTPPDARRSEVPPMGEPNHTQRTCSRLLGRAKDGAELLCGKLAVRHVMYWWDESPKPGEAGFDHGFCCSEHWSEYQRLWKCAGSHEVNPACGMPGSLVRLDGCYFDDLPVAEPVRAVAEQVA